MHIKETRLRITQDYDVRRAAMFLKLLRYSYSSSCKSFASQPFDIRKLFGLIKELEDRMANVVVENQDLHALSNIDYVIISPKEFVEAATRLAKKHEEVDHLTWAVVTDEQVYNEFSSGTPDVSAYRWLMKMLYDRAEGNPIQAPKYLLLMGNASYDNRKLLKSSGVSKLLVYEARNSTIETHAYGTDDYCGFLEDNAGVDIYVFLYLL